MAVAEEIVIEESTSFGYFYLVYHANGLYIMKTNGKYVKVL